MNGDRAHARRTDPETSHKAAEAVTPGLNAIQRQVEAFARTKLSGFLDRDLVEAFPDMGPSTLRTRRAELVARNIILDSGRRERPEGAASPHTIWIHRNYVAGAPAVCDPPPPAEIGKAIDEALAAATLSESWAKQMHSEGRAAFAQGLRDQADLLRRLARAIA